VFLFFTVCVCVCVWVCAFTDLFWSYVFFGCFYRGAGAVEAALARELLANGYGLVLVGSQQQQQVLEGVHRRMAHANAYAHAPCSSDSIDNHHHNDQDQYVQRTNCGTGNFTGQRRSSMLGDINADRDAGLEERAGPGEEAGTGAGKGAKEGVAAEVLIIDADMRDSLSPYKVYKQLSQLNLLHKVRVWTVYFLSNVT
jgi:hypothetical protein